MHGGVFSKQGVQIATRPTWAFQEVLQKAVPSGRSNLARLGELGGKLLPHFPINMGRSEGEKCSALLVFRDHLKLVKKIISVKKIHAEALP